MKKARANVQHTAEINVGPKWVGEKKESTAEKKESKITKKQAKQHRSAAAAGRAHMDEDVDVDVDVAGDLDVLAPCAQIFGGVAANEQ